jgi:hypothetical protein
MNRLKTSNRVSIPGISRNISFGKRFYTGPGAHMKWKYEGVSVGLKWPECDTDHSYHSVSEVMNEMNIASVTTSP